MSNMDDLRSNLFGLTNKEMGIIDNPKQSYSLLHDVTFSSIVGGSVKSRIVGRRFFRSRSHGEGSQSI